MAILTKERQQDIDERIEKIIYEETGLRYPKDNLLDIAESLGVKVYVLDFSDYSEPNKGINGVIEWNVDNANAKAKIYINKDYSSERRRFTLAHELGHFILHPNQKKLRVDIYDYSKDSQESIDETEANYFAASLLMPKEEFYRMLNVSEGDIKLTAKYFGVSLSAVENRLQWLQTN